MREKREFIERLQHRPYPLLFIVEEQLSSGGISTSSASSLNPHEAVLKLATLEISSELFYDVRRQSAAIGFPLGNKRLQIGCNRPVKHSLFWTAPTVTFGFELLGLHTEAEMITTESGAAKLDGLVNPRPICRILRVIATRIITASLNSSYLSVASVSPLAPDTNSADVIAIGRTAPLPFREPAASCPPKPT